MGLSRILRVWLCLAALVICAAAGGCLSVASPEEQSSEETLPWNEPAGWEGKILGAPF